MICAVIEGPSFEEAHKQILQALECADLIELRLDYFDHFDIKALAKLRTAFSIPMIFTLRSALQGGSYHQSEERRYDDIRKLISLEPEYLDVEHHVDPDFIAEITQKQPNIKLILSYHNFADTPENLESVYNEMQKTPAAFYKIAVTARHSLDALRFISWAKTSGGKLIAISMGPHGQISRILSPIIKRPITYASLHENSRNALGQLSANTLLTRYRYRRLTSETAIYGLIGDPVDSSISDETHNALMEACGLNAIYIKIQVTKAELPDFLHFARQLPFAGLSITMPLKEHILSYLDHIDPQAVNIGAINTLVFQESKIHGFNTDGIGALNAIEEKCDIKNKRIVIIGAGGAAKAIIYESIRRGGEVTVVNRSKEKASAIANLWQCAGKGLEEMGSCTLAGYDICINCTSSDSPIEAKHLLPQTYAMEIKTKPKETLFLKHAAEKKCHLIYGYNMFVEQAIEQFHLWFHGSLNKQMVRALLKDAAESCIS